MAAQKQDVIVISLGGSLVAPDTIDTNFLRGFKNLILKHTKTGKKFVIIVGGGSICRTYQTAASALVSIKPEDLDMLGIHVTHMNARLIKIMFDDFADDAIITDPTGGARIKKSILIAAGWKPGFSTDYDAVMLAKRFKVTTILNLTNVDHVYDKDPRRHMYAKPLREISWGDFRKLVGEKWDPGLSAPFDPIAAKEAEKAKIAVVIMRGTDFDNVNNYLEGKDFVGTTIH